MVLELGTLRNVDHKYLESFEMRCRIRMEISWTDRVRNKGVLHRVKEERNALRTKKEGKIKLTALVTSCVGTAF